MGSDGRLFNSAGQLLDDSGYIFNSGPATGQSGGVNYPASHGAFYSYGNSAAYTGSGYSYNYTYQSPSQNW